LLYTEVRRKNNTKNEVAVFMAVTKNPVVR